MKRLWLTVLLISIAAVGIADVSPTDISNLPGNGGIPMGTIPGSDMSIKYLGQLFGSVGGVLKSAGHIQLLQELFAIFNKAILALALAWTSYTIVTVMFNSAMEGGFITSQRKQAVFIFARLALGFSLLLPLSSGYSALQVIGMRALLEGVNLANKVWDETLVFIARKGILHDYSDKDNGSTGALIGNKGWNGKAYINSPSDMKSLTGTQGIMYNMLCTAYYAASNPTSPASQGPTYTPVANSNQQFIDFPSKDSAAGCGQYRLTDNTNNPQDVAQGQIEQSMVTAMWPVAQSIVTAQGINPNGAAPTPVSDGTSMIVNGSQAIADALRDYVSASQLNILNNKKMTKDDYTKDTTWEVQAADQGWLGAGRFYWLLSQANWNNVTNPTGSSSGQTTIPWPEVGTGSGSTLPPQTVALAANAPWNDSKLPASSAIKGVFGTFMIPDTQSAVDGDNAQFTSNPTGNTDVLNPNGLCVDSSTAKGSLPTNIWRKTNTGLAGPVPNGPNSKTSTYYLVSDATSGALKSFASSVKIGPCGQADPDGIVQGTGFDVPVLVKYTGGIAPNSLTSRETSNLVFNKNYPGVRLCAKQGVGALTSDNIVSNIGYCDHKLAMLSIAPGGYGASPVMQSPGFESKGLGGVPFVAQTLSTVAGEFYALNAANSQGLTDPIYFMTQLGSTMLGQAGSLWDNGYDQIHTMALWQGILSGIAPGATILSSFISWWEPVYVAMGGGLFAAGFMLCFYAPLYPFVLYLLGAINWLMVCVEFMIALPLVALGVTHPEGHDFLGKAEVALMLTLSACLRPVLMVFGFMGGMIMSFIGFSAVNYMFSSVLVYVFGNMPLVTGAARSSNISALYQKTPSVTQSIFGVVTNDWTGNTDQAMSVNKFSGSATTDMLLIPLLMVFYGYIVVEVVHFCFTMIHQLPDQVLRWIGGPVAQDRTQGVADKIQSGVSGAVKQAGDMQGKATTAAGNAQGGAIGGSIGAGIQVATDVAKMAVAAK
jgi:hypothetical protein